MKEYIERAEAINAIRQYQYPYGVEFLLANIPAADVAPVRHGRLYLAEDAVFRCSECGRICYELDAPYCYCGARMDKEDEHEVG